MVSMADVDVFPGGADVVGHGVDRDDAGALLGGAAAEELPHPLGGVGGGQDRGRLAVVEHRVQAADVPGLGRVEQRHGDAAGIQGAEEGDHVLQVLRAEDGDPIARLGHLLQPGGDGAVADAELGPVQIRVQHRRARSRSRGSGRRACRRAPSPTSRRAGPRCRCRETEADRPSGTGCGIPCHSPVNARVLERRARGHPSECQTPRIVPGSQPLPTGSLVRPAEGV